MGRSVYATVKDLRAAGLSDTTAFDDDRLIDLLELSADHIESLTGQSFGPVAKTFRANGRGNLLIAEECRNKIIEVTKVEILRFGLLRRLGFLTATPQILGDPEDFTVQDRFIRLQPHDTSPSRFRRGFRDLDDIRFPNEDKNIEVIGVFGHLALEDRFETTLAADLAKKAVEIKLTETSDIERRDLLLIDGRFWVIVDADPTPNVIGPPAVAGTARIGPSPKKAEAGVPVIRFGKVPSLVREAAIRTALAKRFMLGSEDETDNLDGSRIRREETDNYEIEFFKGPGNDRINTGTGDPVADAILSRFRAPTINVGHV